MSVLRPVIFLLGCLLTRVGLYILEPSQLDVLKAVAAGVAPEHRLHRKYGIPTLHALHASFFCQVYQIVEHKDAVIVVAMVLDANYRQGDYLFAHQQTLYGSKLV